MASEVLLSSGSHHLIALNQTEETKSLVAAFQPAHDELQTAAAARAQAEAAMGQPRVVLRFAENALEKVIREVALQAHVVDNNTSKGPAFTALFPDGLNAEVRPLGAAQVVAATALRERLASQPAAAQVKAALADKLDKALAQFKSSFEARQAGEAKLSQARAAELGARERLVKAYDANMGAIRQLFPRERDQQDLYFDDLGGARSTADEKPDAPTPAPAASPTGA